MQRRTRILIVGGVLAAIVGAAILVAPKAIESTEAYGSAERYARSNAAVVAKVGDVMKDAASRNERQSVVFGAGRVAKLGLEVVGSKGTAELSLELREENGQWVVKTARVR